MNKKIEKFREPRHLHNNLERVSEDIFALVLSEISKVKGTNELRKQEAHRKGLDTDEITYLPMPTEFSFTRKELMAIFHIKRANFYLTIGKHADDFSKETSNFLIPDGKGNYEIIWLFRRAKISEGELRLTLSEDGIEYLDNNMDSSYVEMKWDLWFSLKVKYARRLLKLLYDKKISPDGGMGEGYCNAVMSLEEYKERLTCGFEYIDSNGNKDRLPLTMYSSSDSLRNHLIINPMAEIIANAKGCWIPLDNLGRGYQYIKTGKRITGIKFWLRYVPEPAKMKPTPQNKLQDFEGQFVNINGKRLNKESRRIIDSYELFESQILSTPVSERHTEEFKTLCRAYGLTRSKHSNPPPLDIQKLVYEATGIDYFSPTVPIKKA